MHKYPLLTVSSLRLLSTGLILGLSACVSNPGTQSNTTNYAQLDTAGKIAYWQKRQNQQPNIAALHIAKLQISQQQFADAERSLQNVDPAALKPSQKTDYRIVKAELLLNAHNANKALQLIDRIGEPADSKQNITIGLLRARALAAEGRLLDSAQQRIYVSSLLQDDEKTKVNHSALWKTLRKIDSATLEQQARGAQSSVLRGWLTLALIKSRFAMQALKQHEQLNIWQREWPRHPAALDLPSDFQNLQQLSSARPQRISLLLPLSGPLASAGIAVRDGFLAALLESGEQPTLSIIDSTQINNFSDFYNEQVQAGTELVIGPLSKKRLQQLSDNGQPPIPTLALNRSVGNITLPTLFEFGLPATAEARQAAQFATSHPNAMAIYPVGIKGSELYQAFSEEWLAQGGNILERMSYVPRDNYVSNLETALQVDRSKQRAQILQRQLGLPLEFTPRRRKDIDVVFIAAKPEAARSLKPMLAFHYAGDIPVLSVSQVFSGVVQAHKDRDLNGIIYTEMPWFLDRNNYFWQSARDALENSKTMQRMFAFGIDAFELSNKLDFLQQNPELSIPGATGQLSMGQHQQIQRQLSWAQISRGRPRLYHLSEDE